MRKVHSSRPGNFGTWVDSLEGTLASTIPSIVIERKFTDMKEACKSSKLNGHVKFPLFFPISKEVELL